MTHTFERGIEVHVRGCRLEKLLRTLAKRGLRLRDIRRHSIMEISFKIYRRDLQVLREVCVEFDIDIIRSEALGLTRAYIGLRRRAALPVCALLCLLLTGLISARIWLIDINAPDELRDPISIRLCETGIRPGRSKRGLDLRALESGIASAVSGVKFCQARLDGVTLRLTAQPAGAVPERLPSGPPENLYASRDAVIERIDVLAGRAMAKHGDTVRAGELLISGEEQSAPDGVRPVKAMGIVTGRVWYEGLGEAALSQTLLKPTGRTALRRVIKIAGMEWVIKPANAFALCRSEVSFQPIGGLFLPVGVETTRFFELAKSEKRLSLRAAEAAALHSARQNAVKKCPDNATVIDKWTEYSIIEGNRIQARYVMEVEEIIQCRGDVRHVQPP